MIAISTMKTAVIGSGESRPSKVCGSTPVTQLVAAISA
jgi:hypothetical protein